jgi:hypothetical protein
VVDFFYFDRGVTMRLRVAAITATLGLIVGGWAVQSATSAGALGPDSNGVLTMFPNPEVQFGAWYSGVAYPQRGGVLDLGRPPGADQGSIGQNPATVQGLVPVTALPAAPFVVHTAIASNLPLPSTSSGANKVGAVAFYGSNGQTVGEFSLRMSAPDGFAGIDTVGISDPITPPPGAVSMRVGLANFQSGFSLRRVTVNPVAVPPAPLPPARYLDQRRSPIVDQSPLPLLVTCGQASTSLLLAPEQSTVIEAPAGANCTLRVVGSSTEWGFFEVCCAAPTGWSRENGNGQWLYSLVENKLTFGLAKVALRLVDNEPARVGRPLLTAFCTGNGKEVSAGTNVARGLDLLSLDGLLYQDLSGLSCAVTLSASVEGPAPQAYSLNNGPAQPISIVTNSSSRRAQFTITGLRGAAGGPDVLTLDPVGTPPPTTTSPTTSTTTPTTTTLPGTTQPPTTLPGTTQPPTTAPPTTAPPTDGFSVRATPAVVPVGGTVTLSASGLSPATGRVDFTVGNQTIGTGTVRADGTASVTNSLWTPGQQTITATHVTYVNGNLVSRTATGSVTVGTAPPTTAPPTTAPPTTAPPTTAPPTTAPPTTGPGTTQPPTTVAGSFGVTASPSSIGVGGTVTLRATGLTPATGRVDFLVGGQSFGTGIVQPDGTATATNSVWVTGQPIVTATHVTYTNGKLISRTATAAVTVGGPITTSPPTTAPAGRQVGLSVRFTGTRQIALSCPTASGLKTASTQITGVGLDNSLPPVTGSLTLSDVPNGPCSVTVVPGATANNRSFLTVAGLCQSVIQPVPQGPGSQVLPQEPISAESQVATCTFTPLLAPSLTIQEFVSSSLTTTPITGPNGVTGTAELIELNCPISRPGFGPTPLASPSRKCAFRVGRISIPGVADGQAATLVGFTLTVATPPNPPIPFAQYFGPPPVSYALPAQSIPVVFVDSITYDGRFRVGTPGWVFPLLTLART